MGTEIMAMLFRPLLSLFFVFSDVFRSVFVDFQMLMLPQAAAKLVEEKWPGREMATQLDLRVNGS